jgi:GH43 family beta-xylosidase
MHKLILIVALLRLLSICSAKNIINNPLGHHPDPQPISRTESDEKRWYYFPTANGGEGKVNMFASNNLNDIYSLKSPWNKHTIFHFNKNTHQDPEAPAIVKWNDTNYIIYISSDGPTGKRIYALHNDGKDLTRSWTFAGVVQYSDGKPLIGYDAAAFNHPNGNKYLLYSNKTTIFINKLLPNYGFATVQSDKNGKGTIITSRFDLKYTEAPDVLIRGNKLNLLYSQNSFFSPNYTTYNIAISTQQDPLDPKTWDKAKRIKVLASDEQNGVYGTGSVGTFIGADDKPWLAYTCFYDNKPFNRYTSDPRYTQVQPILFKNDEIQPIILVKPDRNIEKVDDSSEFETYIPRYTNLDLRFFHKSAVHSRE